MIIVVKSGKSKAWLQNQHTSFSKTKLETDIQRKEMRSLNLHLPKQNLFHYSKNFLFSEK